MTDPVLRVDSLCKSYPSFKLKNVSFSLLPGRIMGFIGRNGAGKTTTLKAIYGLVEPDSGEIVFQGKSVSSSPNAKNDIGLLFGGIDFYPAQKVKTLTSVTRRFFLNWDQALYEKWLSYFGIDENKKIRELSNGMKVKYGLAVALSHGAKLLLLDEPTSGLDPVSRDELLDCLRKIAEKKRAAILFSTHVISDLEKCADDITYIQKGRILYTGDVPSFKKGYFSVSGEESSLNEEQKASISHLRVKDGRYEGVVSAQDAPLFQSAIRPAELEEIMVSIERGNEDEESPL